MILKFLPDRTSKPRENGLTMMMDKGLGIRQSEDIIEVSANYIDMIKLGFGTSLLTGRLTDKIKLYLSAGLRVYLGGTLFEAFIIRNQFDDYLKFLDKCNITTVEVSDGSMFMHHSEKLEFIRKLSANYTVLSEVGSKQKGVDIPDEVWVQMMQTELEAGSWKVIAEARESGTTGIFKSDGSADEDLINLIGNKLDVSKILWEAPTGKQQLWFIKAFGCNVNLGNIAAQDVIPLECLRMGLRGDTFFDFLPEDFSDKRPDSERYNELD